MRIRPLQRNTPTLPELVRKVEEIIAHLPSLEIRGDGVTTAVNESAIGRTIQAFAATRNSRIDDIDFYCTKTLDENGNDAIAVNGGIMTVIGASWYHRLVFESALIELSELTDNANYRVCAIAYRKTGTTIAYLPRILVLEYAVENWLYADNPGFAEIFVHTLAYFKKTTETIDDSQGGTISHTKLTNLENRSGNGVIVNACNTENIFATLNLPALNDDVQNGDCITTADFNDATVDIKGVSVYTVNANGKFGTYPVANTRFPHSSVRSSMTTIYISNTGTDSPIFELGLTTGTIVGTLGILRFSNPYGTSSVRIQPLAHSPIFWQKGAE